MRAGSPWKATRSCAMRIQRCSARVLGEGLEDRLVGLPQVLGIAGEHRPAEGPLALAEQRPDEQRHEAADVEGLGDAGLLRLPAQVVAVVEGDGAALLQLAASRARAPPSTPYERRTYSCGSRPRSSRASANGSPVRHVPFERVVRRGLVGEHVGGDAAPTRCSSRSTALASTAIETARRSSRAASARSTRSRDVGRHLVEVARVEPPPDARRVDLGDQADALVHRHRQRLRAAHAAEAGGDDETAGEACRRSAGARTRRGSRRCPAGCPACRCRSTSRPSSGRTWSGRALRAAGTRRPSPTWGRAASWRSAPAARPRGCGRPPPACPTARAASRPRPAAAAWRRWRRTPPSCAPPAGAAVDDQLLRVLRHLGIEVVHQHAQRRLLLPAAAGELAAARRAHFTRTDSRRGRNVESGHSG